MNRINETTLAAAMAVVLTVCSVTAEPTVVTGDNPNTATGILDLEVDGVLYDVSFTGGSALDAYGPAPGEYDFSTEASAKEAVSAVNTVLEANGIRNVGIGIPIYNVGYAFQDIGLGLAVVRRGVADELGFWSQPPQSQEVVYVEESTSWANFTRKDQQQASADFAADDTSGLVPLTVTFTNLSSGADDYSWAFGDGNTSTDAQPNNTYTVPGEYTVSLLASNTANGSSDELIRNNYIRVISTNPPLTAIFWADVTFGKAPLTVGFLNYSTGADSYDWAFGDGNTSTNAQPTNTYGAAGTYTVTLTTMGGGDTESLTRTNYIEVVDVDPPTVAQFTADVTSGNPPLTVSFVNLSLNATNYAWDFGDGNTSTEAEPANTYTNEGSYSVTLTVMGGGGTDALTRTNYILVSDDTMVIRGAVESTAVGIVNLDVDGVLYDVTFESGSAAEIYGPAPGVYTFPSQQAASDAVAAVNAALTDAGGIFDVGVGFPTYSVGYSHLDPLIGPDLVIVRRGAVDGPLWYQFPSSQETVYLDESTSWASFLPVSTTPEQPTLEIVLSGTDEVTVSWTPATGGFVLQETTNVVSGTWGDAPSASTNPAVIPATGEMKYLRLRSQ